ncbi:tyrosine-protein phosphatase [Clostridium neonatale]|uniref:tyrosine-protein phosphatase n=1 Tax=Clostridium neonatale TaxID=137838 RepID=UPI003D3324DA
MIDIHSHIIPNIDDGSKSREMTLQMLKNAKDRGTNEIVATPHYLLEYGVAKIEEVKKHVQEINELLKDKNIDIKVYHGQEVYFSERIIEDYLKNNIGTINDSRYMLIEFNMRKFEDNIFDILYELQVRNIIPIIAHPERYREFIERPSRINYFIKEGYLFQLNSGSLEGKLGENARKTAEIFLGNNIYNFIGSDAHNVTSRTTGIDNALKIIRNEYKFSEEIFNKGSKRLIENKGIEFCGQYIKEKKSIFSFLKL